MRIKGIISTNEYLIEWLNMKIDEALQKSNFEDYDRFVELLEREKERGKSE